MKHNRSIKRTLSIATSVLLGSACSSEEGSNITNDPAVLVGVWHSGKCEGVAGIGGGTYTSGSGVTAPIDATDDTSKHEIFTFNDDGTLTITEQNFQGSISCNPDKATDITPIGTAQAYTVGTDITATDGKLATEIDYRHNSTPVYTIYRIHDNTALFFGGRDASSGSNRDGSTVDLRHDGINYSVIFTKQ